MKDGKIELSGEKKIMHNIIEEFEKILNETSWVQEREKFISDSRSIGTRAEDLKEDTEDKSFRDEDDDAEELDDEEVETPDESPSTINLADALEYTKLKSSLNQFRASRSLSDKEVSVELKKYFKRLSDEEKKVLYVLIKGLTQVTLLDVSGKTAYIPSDLKFSISKKGSATSEKIKSKKRAQKLKSEKEIEDATNTPITIGSESIQEKGSILSIVKENA